ncbi:hypothetical protein J6Z48_03420 [bacterium]|nr:hypothetical protein [bacterium]
MEIFTTVWKDWTMYQKSSLLLMGICIFIILISCIYIITRNRRLIIHAIASILCSAIFTVGTMVILHVVFDERISYIYMLIPLVVFLVDIISLSMNLGYYTSTRNKKSFSPISVKKELLRDSLQLSIFIILLFSAISVFMGGALFTFVIAMGATALLIPWTNYLLLYWIYR